MKKQLSILILFILFIFVFCGAASAATVKTTHVTTDKNLAGTLDIVSANDIKTVTVGKDVNFQSISDFNDHSIIVRHGDVYQNLPSTKFLVSKYNYAKVSSTAHPGESGSVHALTGVLIDWDSSNISWDKVKNMKFEFTIDFTYKIGAYWTKSSKQYDYSNAWVDIPTFLSNDNNDPNIPGVNCVNYIGANRNTAGALSGRYTKTFTKKMNGDFITVGNTPWITVQAADFTSTPTDESNINSGNAEITINNIKIHFLPSANAGDDQKAYKGDVVNLDGSDSLPTGLDYTWSFVKKPDGSTAHISDSSIVNPKFTADQPGEYIVQLIVEDNKGVKSQPDTVKITVGNKWAILFSEEKYSYVNTLTYPNDDNFIMRTVLKSKGNFNILYYMDKTKAQIKSYINQMVSKVKPDDLLLFYYAGHGDVDGSGYMIDPKDTYIRTNDGDKTYYNTIYNYQLKNWLDQIKSRQTIIILDSCRSGGFKNVFTDKKYITLAACRASETTLESKAKRLGNGVFTYYLVKSFYSTYYNTDQQLTVQEMFNYASSHTTSLYPSIHPEIYDHNQAKTTYITPKKR